jgi:hypothetical protein
MDGWDVEMSRCSDDGYMLLYTINWTTGSDVGRWGKIDEKKIDPIRKGSEMQ